MEWTTVTVLVSLAGLAGAIITPVVKLTGALTKNTLEISALRQAMEEQKDSIHASFQKLWAHEDEQDDTLVDHENRLHELERK